MTAERARDFVLSLFPGAHVRAIHVGRVLHSETPTGYLVQLRVGDRTNPYDILGMLSDTADEAWIAMAERLMCVPMSELSKAIEGEGA